jgi:hypothetical protein
MTVDEYFTKGTMYREWLMYKVQVDILKELQKLNKKPKQKAKPKTEKIMLKK